MSALLPLPLPHPALRRLSSKTTPISASRTPSTTIQMTSTWISRSKASHLSTSTGPHLVRDCRPSSPSSSQLCSLQGAATSEDGGSISPSRARHMELLHTIVAGATRTVSTPARTQSGAYPGPSSAADERVVMEPSPAPAGGSVTYPTVRYLSAFASCGLQGCATTYSRPHSLQHSVSVEPQVHSALLPITYEAPGTVSVIGRQPSAPPAIDYQPEMVRHTGTYSLSG